MKSQLIIFLCILLLVASCNKMEAKINKIKEVIEKNCNCEKVEIETYIKDSIETISFNIYNCKDGTDYKEADKIISILSSKVEDFCAMDEKINIQFVNTQGTITKYYPNVYWKCTIQFEF